MLQSSLLAPIARLPQHHKTGLVCDHEIMAHLVQFRIPWGKVQDVLGLHGNHSGTSHAACRRGWNANARDLKSGW